MKARCTSCNAATEIDNRNGKLSEQKCPCGGRFVQMKSRQISGEAPMEGFTLHCFGETYHNIYTGGGGQWLYDRRLKQFFELKKEEIPA